MSQVPSAAGQDSPTVIRFVAPAYPRAAKDARIMGKTVTQFTVNRDGVVTEARAVLAHRVFESYILEAFRQWRFKPSDREYTVEVTCFFEFTEGKCEGSNLHPITPETYVSAELPTVVRVRTGMPCLERVDQQRQ